MNPNDREDSSKYVNQNNEDAAIRSIEAELTAASVARAPKPKKSKAPVVLSVFLVLALAAAGVLGWLWYQQGEDIEAARSDLKSNRSQISQLQNELSEAKTSTDEKETSIPVAKADSELLIDAVKANIDANVNEDSDNARIEIMKMDGDFASINISGPTAGVGCMYKKSNEMWLKLYCAHQIGGEIERLNELYGVPESFTQT